MRGGQDWKRGGRVVLVVVGLSGGLDLVLRLVGLLPHAPLPFHVHVEGQIDGTLGAPEPAHPAAAPARRAPHRPRPPAPAP